MYFRQHIEDVEDLGALGPAQPMLVEHVVCEGEHVRLGHTDGFVIRDAKQAQEDFLNQVGRIRGIAYPSKQEASQPLTVLGGNGDNECLLFVGVQAPNPSRIPLAHSARVPDEGKWIPWLGSLHSGVWLK